MEFDPRDQELQKQWQKIATDVVAPVAATIDATGEIPESLLRHLDELKLLTPFLPTELGGEDRGLQSLSILLEEIARHSPVTALLCAQQVVVGIRANLRCFNLGDRSEWGKKASQFKAIFTLAASENEAGSDLTSIQTTCRRTADGEFVLNGEKAYVNWAARAAWIIALARTQEQEGRGFSLFAVPGSAVGLEFDASHPTMGLQGIAAAPIRFRDVKLTAERVAGVYGFGFDPYDQMLNEMRICV
ncbi:MAG TPA: acyl-CoA dehydrogenase family protein, partial [Candidatus Ozemobacteraceae bacterium]|nr:acyl-CoA dehydrogenase family protein [Candidatus Ozemobacteraceae bacterium]